MKILIAFANSQGNWICEHVSKISIKLSIFYVISKAQLLLLIDIWRNLTYAHPKGGGRII